MVLVLRPLSDFAWQQSASLALISLRWRARDKPLDHQETDLTSIRFAVASGARGTAR
jgi:hypothetical protein